jgi:hypothetical protein
VKLVVKERKTNNVKKKTHENNIKKKKQETMKIVFRFH